MKILLALPRFQPNANPPLGIAHIASYLREKGFDVEILDPTFESWEFAVKRLKKTDFDVLGLSCYTMNFELAKRMAEVAKKANNKVLTVFGGAHPTILPEQTINEKIVDAVVLAEGEKTFAELAERLQKGKSLKGV